MYELVALTGIIVAAIVIGIVAIVAIVFGMLVRSKASSDGFELHVEPEQKAKTPTAARPKKKKPPPVSTHTAKPAGTCNQGQQPPQEPAVPAAG